MKSKYLRPEDIRALRRYAFVPRSLVEGQWAGRHSARAVGSSTEFRDYRPYVPGDDLRRVDWRVYARTDRHYLRTHNQETDTVCHILLDSSASMGFGARRSKLDYASHFAAGLSYLVARNKDAVSLCLFDAEVRQAHPPGSTTGHLHALLAALEHNQPAGETGLESVLTRLFPQFRRKGALVVLSDFWGDPAACFAALNPYLHRGFDVHLFHVLDPQELDLPDRGLATFQDLETRGRMIAHIPSLRRDYAAALRQHVDSLRELARRRRVNYTLARTDQPHWSLFDRLAQ